MVEPEVINQGKDKNDLNESPYSFSKNPADRLFFFQEERTGNHEENGNGSLHPEGDGKIQRKEK